MNLRIFRTPDDLALAAAGFLLAKVEGLSRPVVALSGGSTPRRLYQLLGEGEMRERLADQEIVWVTGDERCVPPDHEESNARMIRETLFRNGMPPRHRFLRFPTEKGSAEVIARRFGEEWHRLEIGRIDVALLGVGGDGHTASLFPGTTALEVEEEIATSVWVPRLQSWRVTLTVPVLRESVAKAVLAEGKSKRDILDRARKGESMPVLRVAGDDASWWFVDEEAISD